MDFVDEALTLHRLAVAFMFTGVEDLSFRGEIGLRDITTLDLGLSSHEWGFISYVSRLVMAK